MKQELATVESHEPVRGDYHCLTLATREISRLVEPGQFLEILVPRLKEAVLRRPFSVFNVHDDCVSILYKVVGKGTESLQRLAPGDGVDIIGPLGNGFPRLTEGHFPVLVAGGYGAAALYLQAGRSARKGVILIGGKAEPDILCVREFKELDWEVVVATEDGSAGFKGLITDAFDQWLDGYRETQGANEPIEIFACGPEGLLQAMSDRAKNDRHRAWLSMDRHMGCGMGVCLTCVIRRKTSDGNWEWARCCKEGPVFESGEVLWDE